MSYDVDDIDYGEIWLNNQVKELSDKNERLKKLLLRCKDYLPEWITPMDILAEIDKLEEK